MYERVISKIIRSLEEERATLVLGPGIFEVSGMSIENFVRQEIVRQFPEQIVFYYDRDGLFVLKSQDDRPEIAEAVSDLYRNLQPNENLFRKILEIPFSLVVSVNPDTFLSDSAFNLGVRHRFSVFYTNYPEDIEEPTREVPLFYNIAGCVNRQESLILSFDDQFRLFQGMLAVPGLPPKLLNKLGHTKSFVFIGLRFDRWYTQLLLRLINIQGADQRLAYRSALSQEETQIFLIHQFKIDFPPNDFDLIDELHDACATANILRKTSHSKSVEKDNIISLLERGETEKAIEELLVIAKNTPHAEEMSHISARFHFLKSERDKIDSRDFFTQINQLTNSIIQIAKKLHTT